MGQTAPPEAAEKKVPDVDICARMKADQKARLEILFEQMTNDERVLLVAFAELMLHPLNVTSPSNDLRESMANVLTYLERYLHGSTTRR